MNAKHPMTDIFVQKVQAIVSSIFKKEQDYETFKQMLEAHLARAEKLEAPHYAVNVLNGLYINNVIFHPEKIQSSKAYLDAAYAAATTTGDAALIIRISNNLGSFHWGQFNHAAARPYLDAIINEIPNLDTPSQSVLFASGMLIDDAVLAGDFEQALTLVDDAFDYAHRLEIASGNQHNYARAIFFLRANEVRVNLGAGNYDHAHSTNRLAEGINKQLDIASNQETIRLNYALHTLLSADEAEDYQSCWQAIMADKTFNLAELASYAMLLHHKHCAEQAQEMRHEILARAQTEITDAQVRERIATLLQPIVEN